MQQLQSACSASHTENGLANDSETDKTAPGRDVLLGAERDRRRRDRANPDAGWRILGFLGVLLAVIGFVDVLLNLYPPAFDSPEWEFGTVTRMLTSMPLPTVGFAGMAAWGFARGGRKSRIALAVASFAVLALVAAAYLLFLLNVPLAWSATEGPQGPAIIRSIVRTTVMGVGFGIAYLVLGISLIRTLTPRTGR